MTDLEKVQADLKKANERADKAEATVAEHKASAGAATRRAETAEADLKKANERADKAEATVAEHKASAGAATRRAETAEADLKKANERADKAEATVAEHKASAGAAPAAKAKHGKSAKPVTYKAPHEVYVDGVLVPAGKPFTTNAARGEAWEEIGDKERAAQLGSDKTVRQDPDLTKLDVSGLMAVAVMRGVDTGDTHDKHGLIDIINAAADQTR